MNGNGVWKWIAAILAGLLLSLAGAAISAAFTRSHMEDKYVPREVIETRLSTIERTLEEVRRDVRAIREGR